MRRLAGRPRALSIYTIGPHPWAGGVGFLWTEAGLTLKVPCIPEPQYGRPATARRLSGHGRRYNPIERLTMPVEEIDG